MTRTEICHGCGRSVVAAFVVGGDLRVVILDAEHDPHGSYRARYGASGVWIAHPVNPHALMHTEAAKGVRRRVHECPDEQLGLEDA